MFGALTISLVLTAVTFTNILSLLTGIPTPLPQKSLLFWLCRWYLHSVPMWEWKMVRSALSHAVCLGVVLFAVYVLVFTQHNSF